MTRRKNINRFPFLAILIAMTISMPMIATAMDQEPEPVPTEGSRIYVSSNKLMVDGQEIRLKGVNLVGYDWRVWKSYQFASKAKYQQMANYDINVVRLTHIKYTYWMTDSNKNAYRALFDKAVQYASEYGIYVIIPWGVWDDSDTGITGMPKDKNAWIAMWRDIATRFKDSTNVILEIHNEPHSENNPVTLWWSWAQECINAIRAIDATVPILVPLHDYATAAYNGPLKDGLLRGGNIFYDVHYYWWHYDSNNGQRPNAPADYTTVSNWFKDRSSSNPRGHNIYSLGRLAPILIGEFGTHGQSPLANDRTWLNNMFRIIDEQGWSYAYFA